MEIDQVKTLMKFSQVYAKPVLEEYKASSEAIGLSSENILSSDFLQKLIEKELYVDAIKFLAYGLPVREGVWWAYLCARDSECSTASELTQQALEKVKQWVFMPNENNRRATQPYAEKLAFQTSTSWVAISAFWSSGSITPLDNPPVMAPKNLAPSAIAGAVLLAGIIDPTKYKESYQLYLAKGIHIANNGNGDI